VIVLVAVCAGIVVDRLVALPVVWWWAVAAGAWMVWLGLWRSGRQRSAGVAVLLAVAATAAGGHHCRWNLFPEDDLGNFARRRSQPICIEAIALKGTRRLPAAPPDPMRIIPQGDRTRVEVEVVGVRDGADWRPASGAATLNVGGDLSGVRAGDRLRIFGYLAAPRTERNPGEHDYARHLRADRQRGTLRASHPECVSVVRRATGWSPWRALQNARTEGNRLLWHYLGQRRAGLAAAVLLGDRGELGAERSASFQRTGTVHLLAISGLHVGIVAWMVFGLMRLLLMPRNRALLVVVLVTVLYTVMSDARPPAIRATILVIVMCVSHYLGRRVIGFNSLAAAALVVLAFNPADLFRVGPQLSFLAVGVLMWFAPSWFSSTANPSPLEVLVERTRSWPQRVLWFLLRSARHLTLVSATIWLFTSPLTMARFHVIAPIAVALNTVLWIPMVVALGSGFGVLVFGRLFPPAAVAASWCCDGCLWLLDSAVAAARDAPWGHFWVPGPAEWWLAGFYGSAVLMAAFPRIRPPRRWCVALLAGWVAIGFAAPTLRDEGGRLECTFLSVGHGSSVVLALPSGATMLYDAGQFTSPYGGARAIAGCLWARGVTHLDAVVISHADADHYNALPELLERFSVGVVYVSPVMFEDAESGGSLAPATGSMWAVAAGSTCCTHPGEACWAATTPTASSWRSSIAAAGFSCRATWNRRAWTT
jgi:competence protein ComEC